jgi:hypothetical protein
MSWIWHGGRNGIIAAILNILFILVYQAGLIPPEVAKR